MTIASPTALLTQKTALFLDFDGTLAGLQDDPDTVWLDDGLDAILVRCAEKLGGALAILSGRDVDDLSRRVPNGLWRFGNHGLRTAGPGETPDPATQSAPETLCHQIEEAITPYQGVRLEKKGAVLAVHYRGNPNLEGDLSGALSDIVSEFPDYKIQNGKMVLEAKPSLANKGRCLTTAMTGPPFLGRIPLMIGDDTTDEDAFAAAQAAGGAAIKVGSGTTIANYRLADVSSVHELLKDFQTV